MASSFRNNVKDNFKDSFRGNVKRDEYNKGERLAHGVTLGWQSWQIRVLGVFGLLFAVGLLTQLPGVSLWIGGLMGSAVGTWFVRIALVAVMGAIAIALVKAFFTYVREEFGIGPTPVCAFFMLGFILALLNSI